MTKPLALEFVRKVFAKEGCTLKAEVYVSNNMPMLYICKCGTEWKTSYADFIKGARCKKCRYRKSSSATRLSLIEAKKRFLERDLDLLATEYQNAQQNLKYRCRTCKYIGTISISNLAGGKGCPICGNRIKGLKKRSSQSFVQKIFLMHGCVLLSKYKNNYEPLKFICKCLRLSEISFHNFRYRKQCGLCGRRRGHDKQRFASAVVELFFQVANCKLITHYVRSSEPLEYECSCGKLSKTYLGNFLRGVRCATCGHKKRVETRHMFREAIESNNIFETLTQIIEERRKQFES